MIPQFKPAKLTQRQSDIAALLRLTIGDTNFKFGFPDSNSSLILSNKYKRMLSRVAGAVGCTVHCGVAQGTIRHKDVLVHRCTTPRELAARVLELYNEEKSHEQKG